jgi:hypothetical protein
LLIHLLNRGGSDGGVAQWELSLEVNLCGKCEQTEKNSIEGRH